MASRAFAWISVSVGAWLGVQLGCSEESVAPGVDDPACEMFDDETSGRAPRVTVKIENLTEQHLVLRGSDGSCEGLQPVYEILDTVTAVGFGTISCRQARSSPCLGGETGCNQAHYHVVLAPGAMYEAERWDGRMVEQAELPELCVQESCPSSCARTVDAPDGNYQLRASAHPCTLDEDCPCLPDEGSTCTQSEGVGPATTALEVSASLAYPEEGEVVLTFE